MATREPCPEAFNTFGSFLRYLRKRARMTQRDLGLAVGYSVPQVSLLENDQRLPNLTTLAALFVPALRLQAEPKLMTRLLELAAASRHASKAATNASLRPDGGAVAASPQAVTVGRPSSAAHQLPNPNLPAPLASLLGRVDELDKLRTVLLDPGVRLITLLGPPGVGKTSLALELARLGQQHFGDGAFWIDLSAVDEPALVPAALRASIGLARPLDPAVDELDVLCHGLRDRQALLVIDNFEQVIDAATVVAAVLLAASEVKAIVTSRAALEVYGEHIFTVAPLPLPDLSHLPSPAGLQRYPAIALFVQRARRAARVVPHCGECAGGGSYLRAPGRAAAGH